jgi:hypothetical protein
MLTVAMGSRFLSAYYILNPAFVACYALLRLHYAAMRPPAVDKYSHIKSMVELDSWVGWQPRSAAVSLPRPLIAPAT